RDLSVDEGIEPVAGLGEVLYRYRNADVQIWAVRLHDGSAALLQTFRQSVTVHLAAASADALQDNEAAIVAALRPVEPPEDKVGITFWAGSECGPDWAHRQITAPSWPEL